MLTMITYKDSSLWKEAFNDKYGHSALRERLVKAFEIARNNASYLLEKIRIDFPSLTIHDITHVDSLWQVASTIAGGDYKLNPLEGFILGVSFLIHDAALSYIAIGGKETLRSTTEWKDFYTDYISISDMTDEEKEYETDFRTIRYLHAKYASNLCDQIFEKENGTTFYIIEDDELRRHLWQTIGDIAYSHHWEMEKVKTLGEQIPALAGFPSDWRINPLKLACLLRCADAGHIDSGRAPDYLLKLLDINGVSRNHWEAQNKLSQIDIDKTNISNVIIASNIAFTESDYAAWNVVYDAVMVLNNELTLSYEVLNNLQEPIPFQTRRVSGAGSREELCKYVKTKGWFPCDVNIHISNIEGIIKTLGGEKLYGKEKKLEYVIRELIQNARDAIVARRHLEEGFEGRIDVIIEEIDNKQWLIIKDNGIGMSMQGVKDYLLNFGNSFWASDLAKIENPGLASSGFKSIGQFGIGFHSIFMIASEVIVDTRKFNESLNSNIKLHFPNGLCLRPIVSRCKGSSMNVSTVIKVCINPKEVVWDNIVKLRNTGLIDQKEFIVPFRDILANITAGLDVDVYYKELEQSTKNVHISIISDKLDKRKWLIDATYANHHENQRYVNYINANYNRLRYIYHKGQIVGLAALNTLYQHHSSYLDIHTVGGLSTFTHDSRMGLFMGYISEKPETAKRDGRFTTKILNEWAIEQYDILLQQGLTDIDKIWLPYNLCDFEIDMCDVMKTYFVNNKFNYFTYDLKELILLLNNGSKLVFAISPYGNDERIDSYTDRGRSIAKLDNNEYLFIPCTNSSFLNTEIKDNNGFNIISCIQKVATKMGNKIQCKLVDNKTYSSLFGLYKGLIISECD